MVRAKKSNALIVEVFGWNCFKNCQDPAPAAPLQKCLPVSTNESPLLLILNNKSCPNTDIPDNAAGLR